MWKRILSLLLLLVLLSTISLSVTAHEVPDFDRSGSVSITMRYQGKPVSGGTLTAYRVADVVSDNGDMIFAYTADFAGCTIPVTELDSADLPAELARIARNQKRKGTTVSVDNDGEAVFSGLQLGLYLIVQEKAPSGYKKINPFLVSIPYYDNGRYIYDVDTAPKNLPGLEKEPVEPKKWPKDFILPQTGQTNWPVPVMAAAGVLLVAAGICLRSTGKRKQDEA